MHIRPEAPADIPAIAALTEAAFAGLAYASGREAAIVEALRADGHLTLSLVAVDPPDRGGALLGHVAFSPLRIDAISDHWYALGPLSVTPARQRQGIGRALVAEGLTALRALGARGCALVGNPAVYGPMGFESDGRLRYGDLPPTLIQRHVFSGPAPAGELGFAPAFSATE